MFAFPYISRPDTSKRPGAAGTLRSFFGLILLLVTVSAAGFLALGP